MIIYFPCKSERRRCKLEHILNWFKMFVDLHNNRSIIYTHVKWSPWSNSKCSTVIKSKGLTIISEASANQKPSIVFGYLSETIVLPISIFLSSLNTCLFSLSVNLYSSTIAGFIVHISCNNLLSFYFSSNVYLKFVARSTDIDRKTYEIF